MDAKVIAKEIKELEKPATARWLMTLCSEQDRNLDIEEATDILDNGYYAGVLTNIGDEYTINNLWDAYSEEKAGKMLDEWQKFLDKFFKNVVEKTEARIFTIYVQAEKYGELQPFFYDKYNIWWLWNKTNYCWEMKDEVDLLNMIKKATDKDTIASKRRQEILNALKQQGRLNTPKTMKPSWVQFKRRIIDIENDEEFWASPNYFVVNPINWNLGKEETSPMIDKLFVSWVGEDHKEELYEILAFCLVPNYFIHRIIWLIGSGANGKSTFFHILRKLIGNNNTTSISLDNLISQRFAGAKLLKKLVCLMGETNFNTFKKTDILKKLSGGDSIPGEIKNKNPFDFENYAKLLMASNSMPMTTDKTEGFYRRQKVIDFPNKFIVESDVLSTIPDVEYENLAFKCLNIAKRLWKDRLFTNDGDFEERKRRYEEKSNPIMLFLQQNYNKDPNGLILFSEFSEGLNDFLNEGGYRVLSAPTISKQLVVEGFDVKQKTVDGQTAKYIWGISKGNNPNI